MTIRTHAVYMALLFFFAFTPLAAAATETPATIEVIGKGAVSARPDQAVLTFAIETSAASANDAIRQNAALSDKLITMLKQKMEKDDRIATTQFQLNPVYDQKMRIAPSSFRVRNSVRLETNQVDDLGKFIDTAAQAGSGRIGQLRFSHSNNDELARKAAALAVEDARRTAEALARAAGVKITRLHRIHYTDSRGPGPMRAEMAMTTGATPIEVGQLIIERQITAVFMIE
ncbi:MAG: SIMPL domain-containing protein [Desulfobacterales bacterium]|nr:SIMPL domain-containing protein [Desulfobacterales bacterium]MDJ0884526.1 SIMPL domain-containing protein [Desulfobacterales bacterium]